MWVWRLRPGTDHAICTTLHQQLTTQSCQINANELAPLLAVTQQHQITVVCGINECTSAGSQSTLYNSEVCISAHPASPVSFTRE